MQHHIALTMASIFQLQPIFLCLLLTSLLISPAYSLTCTSQTFTGNSLYKNCADLPFLKSFLHYSYEPTNSTLSIAFIAPPPSPNGWIAWAINPTATGMAGSQTFLAYKDSNGSVLVKTYNISSYKSIVESKLSFDVLEKRAEFSNGSFTIFATVVLPKSLTAKINQVWQVGQSVKGGRPEKHDFQPENLGAKGVLDLMKDSVSVGAPAPAPTPAPVVTPATSEGGSGGKKSGSGRCNCDLWFLVSFFIFPFLWSGFY